METNKILGAIILALLLAAVFSKVADMAIHPEFPDELAYKIEIPEGGVTTSVSEDVDIFAVLPDITPMLASASMENGEKIFKKCASCHTHDKGGENKIGPALYNVLGRQVGGVTDYKYSSALTEYGKSWTFEEMNGFLKKPASYIKGTKMAFAGLRKEKDRASVIKYLNQNSDNPKQLP